MAIIRQINEFTRESVILGLEPSRTCAAHCSYCFAMLNNANLHIGNRSKSFRDTSTFERMIERAYSPNYDPTDFVQYSLRNRFVLGWANTTEPWQDKQQAISILQLCNKFSLPLFLQMKGLNFDAVCDYLKPFADNSSIFVSLPSLDQRVAKRFEPGTPPIAERLRIIEWLRNEDFYVIGALSPYCEQWAEDPVKLVDTLADTGVNQIFFDYLHLSQRQASVAKDKLMVSLASVNGKAWPPKAIDHMLAIYHQTIANDLEFFGSGWVPTCYGAYNTLPTINPDYAFQRGRPWPYHDGNIFRHLESTFYSEDRDITPVQRDFNDSILVTWNDCLTIMEADGGIDQPFAYKSLVDIVAIYKKLPEVWKRAVGKLSPISEWFRAVYNCPSRHQFFSRHPWVSVAVDMNGVPHLDSEGNIQYLFDPDFTDKYKRCMRKCESLEPFRRLDLEKE
jgi:DNA repair photolyase